MKIGSKGFGLLELMIAIVLSTIVMLGIYQYWIKGLGTMTDSVRISALKGRAQLTFNNIVSDLKLIGYNPRQKMDPFNNIPFGIIAHTSPYDSITYSFYNEDSDDDAAYLPVECADMFCTRSSFWIQNGTLFKKYFDVASAAQADMLLLNNACVRFILWGNDKDTSAPPSQQILQKCTCQEAVNNSFTRCLDSNGDGVCTLADNETPPTSIQLILAVKADENLAVNFDAECKIPGQEPRYVRFEKMVYLTNLR